MPIVLDTNVVVSRFISPMGIPARVYGLWEDSVIDVAVTESILREYKRILKEPELFQLHRVPTQDIDRIMADMRSSMLTYDDEPLAVQVSSNPHDDKFLSCAVAASADYIISGDKHLRTLGDFQGIPILTPAIFLAMLESGTRL